MVGNSLRMTVTDRVDGTTRTLFVPADRQEEVARWNGSWKEMREILRSLSELQRKVESGVVAWTAGVRFTAQSEGDEFNVVACEESRGGAYRGMFATNYDADCAEVASEVVAWGRHSVKRRSGGRLAGKMNFK